MHKKFLFVNPFSSKLSGGNIYNERVMYELNNLGHQAILLNQIDCDFIQKENEIVIFDAIDLESLKKLDNLDVEKTFVLIHLWPTKDKDLNLERELEVLLELQKNICKTSKLVFTSSLSLDQTKEFFFEELKSYHIIPPGIDSNWKRKKSYNQIATNFLVIGNFCRRKRQIEIIESFIEINDQIEKEISITLVGRADNLAYLEEMMKVKSIHSNINIYSEVNPDKINDLILNTDVLISFSEEESYCMAVQEAINTGCPFISTPTGNFREFGKSSLGYILSDFTKESLRQSIKRIVLEKDFYRNLCKDNYAVQFDSWERVAKKFLAL